MENWKIANILEMAVRRAKRGEIWDYLGLLYMGYLWLCTVQAHLGSGGVSSCVICFCLCFFFFFLFLFVCFVCLFLFFSERWYLKRYYSYSFDSFSTGDTMFPMTILTKNVTYRNFEISNLTKTDWNFLDTGPRGIGNFKTLFLQLWFLFNQTFSTCPP